MEVKNTYNKIIAEKLICNFKKRGIEGCYFENSKSLIPYIKELIPDGALVSWGGSMTLNDTGIFEFLRKGNYKVLDRDAGHTPEKLMQVFIDSFSADYYFTGTNAITIDGKLVNVDGRGNRIAAMSFGPKNVIVVSGLNKVVKDEEEAISRIKNYAAPLNAIRLKKETPCVSNGKCGDCFEPGCICSYTVITRKSNIPGRIKVFLVGEDLGY